jgi:BirA family biotin operon repressor/biotin-[acetyl-CoA-carboxylase] ligase
MMNYKLISFDKISSTQTYSRELVAAGKSADRTIILADAQTAGRGRYRRKWISHHGNLYASFIYKTETRNPKLSYSVAIAVAETLISIGIFPQIKWPNDILVDNKKISGILIEYAKDFTIVGIGINIKNNPKIKSYLTSKVADFVPMISRDELLAILINNIDEWIARDFSIVQKRWTQLAANINEVITYRGKPSVLCGLNDNGALVLRRGSEYIMAYGDEISV